MRNFRCEKCDCSIKSGKPTNVSIYQGRVCDSCFKNYKVCDVCKLGAAFGDHAENNIVTAFTKEFESKKKTITCVKYLDDFAKMGDVLKEGRK